MRRFSPGRLSRRHLGRIADQQARTIIELRRTIMAQGAALDVLTASAEEHVEAAEAWRTIALNTADFYTWVSKTSGGES